MRIALCFMLTGLVIALSCLLAAAAPDPAAPFRATAELGAAFALADQPNTVYLRVNLRGKAPEDKARRTPVNIALVLDKSGSMQGDKIEKAKEAAIMAIGRLAPDDIVSVVTYDSSVTVLVPATRAMDKEHIYAQIERITAGGNTALFAGVSKGAAELRKFKGEDRATRLVLLSDGLANVGPSSPGDLAELGESLRTESIHVSTIGLGLDYNEDLMARLALSSGGNHLFAEGSSDLARAFDLEFGDALTVAAQDVTVRIKCEETIRPVRVLGHSGVIDGQQAVIEIPQVYANQDRYVILELEVPAHKQGDHLAIAEVEVQSSGKNAFRLAGLRPALQFTKTASRVEASVNTRVMAAVARQIGAERMIQAQRLRDAGHIDAARELYLTNRSELFDLAEKYRSEHLRRDALSNQVVAEGLEGEEWRLNRKLSTQVVTEAQLQGLGYTE